MSEQKIKITHCCIMHPTMNLRWKASSPAESLYYSKTLEQSFICQGCGKREWRELPVEKEEI